MPDLVADASPEKRLFLEMFTRDLSLEDCILDLIDNSIDALIKTRNVDVSDALLPIKENGDRDEGSELSLGTITINYSSKFFEIVDTCGGISLKDALGEVFRFGHTPTAVTGQLGVYGIGLKRAIFKIGNDINIHSETISDGFIMHIDVPSWANESSWGLPLQEAPAAASPASAGCTISIKSFSREVTERFGTPLFEKQLYDMIASTYPLFLGRYVNVSLNGHNVEPKRIPLASSSDVNIAKEVFINGGVSVTLYAGLAARNADGQWQGVDAGWYAACNGRLVVVADKTELTGWGAGSSPTYQPKYRGFVGVIFFYSKNPLLLPWTTMKRGINKESLVFQEARGRMATIARPIFRFLDNMYAVQETEREAPRRIAEKIDPVDVRELTNIPQALFVPKPEPVIEQSIRIQYFANVKEIERIRKRLRKSNWSGAQIGRFTFEHYLKNECPLE
jgi:hypothetical protein